MTKNEDVEDIDEEADARRYLEVFQDLDGVDRRVLIMIERLIQLEKHRDSDTTQAVWDLLEEKSGPLGES